MLASAEHGDGSAGHPGTPAEYPAGVPCLQGHGDLWFSGRPGEVELAKSLCRECPVRELCLAGALDREEPWGVWGGELFENGVVVPRKRPRGRPPKNPVAA